MNKGIRNCDELRCEYQGKAFLEETLEKDPFAQFDIWFSEALDHDPEPNAMIIATVSPLGHPSTRAVLLKKWSKQGFCFYTGMHSRKAEQLASNPYISATFLWKSLDRQIHLEGRVQKLTRKDVEQYFAKRPKGAQIATHASSQSLPLSSAEEWKKTLALLRKKYQGKNVPCPKNWGGYCIRPHRFEFWQGKKDRLHDRFIYVLEGRTWIISRLSP